jgi:transaldolase
VKFFIDTANIEEIAELHETGLLDGVTTNPTLIKQSGRNIMEVLKVSGEVAATDLEGMKREGDILAAIADNIAIKVPMTWDGLKACRYFADQGRMVNVTLCFSASQALLAAKAGAAFVSPFVGRLDDISMDGLSLIAEICTIYGNYDFGTEVLVASVRNPLHVVESSKMGADVATIPYKVMRQLLDHPLTDKGLAAFVKDWAATGQVIG